MAQYWFAQGTDKVAQVTGERTKLAQGTSISPTLYTEPRTLWVRTNAFQRPTRYARVTLLDQQVLRVNIERIKVRGPKPQKRTQSADSSAGIRHIQEVKYQPCLMCGTTIVLKPHLLKMQIDEHLGSAIAGIFRRTNREYGYLKEGTNYTSEVSTD
ncbi:hypothetical protein J6590_059666 [Homalodisca vitripennis]|nr:hypothetical protein J6590_059666 [Homalodisca vitripennis]